MIHSQFTPDNYVSFLAERTYGIYRFRASTLEELSAWQTEFRRALRHQLGLDYIAETGKCKLEPELIASDEAEDHIREEWTVQTEPGFRVPFYLLRPKHQSTPLPVVITPHGHGKQGKLTYVGLEGDGEGDRDVALQAVRAGYVAIAPDARAFASMRTKADVHKDSVSSCRHLAMRALLFGRTLLGERVWDMERLMDYAATRPEIDSSRIIITGNSGGGTVSLFTAACDERVMICIPGSYFCTFEDSIGAISHCECNYVPGVMRLGEMCDVAGLIAPRPFMCVNGKSDPIFPYKATRRAFADLQRIYQVAGVPERCRLSTGNEGHRYYRKDVWPFVREWIDEISPQHAAMVRSQLSTPSTSRRE